MSSGSKEPTDQHPKPSDDASPLEEGRDFYFDSSGLLVMTASYLQRRGYCCGNGCRHCPY